MNARFGWAWVVGFVLLGTASPVFAEGTDDATRAAARSIATAGVNAYQQNDFALASAKLEKAYSLVKAPTFGLWSARSLVKLGKLVQASERYREVGRLSFSGGDPAVQKQAQVDAAAELEALVPRVPSIVIQLSGAVANETSIRVNGVAVSAALVGEQMLVDPGDHAITAENGGRRVRAHVSVAEGERKTVELAFRADASQPNAPAPVVPAGTASQSEPNAKQTGKGIGTQRSFALVSGGIGVVGVALGTVFGLKSKSNHDRAANLGCSGATCPTDDGLKASADARSAGNFSTVAFAVGVAGVVGGAALWFTARPAQTSSTQVGAGFGSIQLRGSF